MTQTDSIDFTTPNGAAATLIYETGVLSITVAKDGVIHKFRVQSFIPDMVGDSAIVTQTGEKIMVGAADRDRVSLFYKAHKPKKNSNTLVIVASVIGGLILLSAIGSMISGNDGTSATAPASPDAATTSTPTPAVATPIGVPVRAGNATIAVTNVALRSSVGGDYFKETAADGGVLVVITTQVRNVGDKPIKSYDLPKLKLVDASGVEYSPDIGKTGAYATEADLNDKLVSDLNPDIAVKDADVFEVSKTRFNPATWYAVTSDGDKIALQ